MNRKRWPPNDDAIAFPRRTSSVSVERADRLHEGDKSPVALNAGSRATRPTWLVLLPCPGEIRLISPF